MHKMEKLYREFVGRRIQQALDTFQMVHPGIRPDAIVVGETIRSQMAISQCLRISGGQAYYDEHRIFFCEASDTCMAVRATPG